MLDLPPAEFQSKLLDKLWRDKRLRSSVLLQKMHKSTLLMRSRVNLVTERELREHLTGNPSDWPAYLVLANLFYQTPQSHVPWTVLRCADCLTGRPNSLVHALADQALAKYLADFPFLRDVPSLYKSLDIDPSPKPDYKNLDALTEEELDARIHTLQVQRQYKVLLDTAGYLAETRTSFFLVAICALFADLKEYNAALKILLLLTLKEPVDFRTLLLWGRISLNLASPNRGYWPAKLATLAAPGFVGCWINLGGVCFASRTDHAESKFAMTRAFELDPENISVRVNLANVLAAEGNATGAAELVLSAEDLFSPGKIYALSVPLLYAQYSDRYGPAQLTELHRRYGEWIVADTEPWPRAAPPRGTGGRTRVALISPDLVAHPVAYYIEPLLRYIDRSRIELHVFFTLGRSDSVTSQLKELAEHWHDAANLTDDQLCYALDMRAIHIAIDCSGHTAANRLKVFARKPVPVQVSYCGYPYSSGLPQIDYRFVDAHTPDDNRYWSEKPWLVNPSAQCYQPLVQRQHLVDSEIFSVRQTPALSNGYVTYGISTNLAKVNQSVLETFAAILTRQPKSRLIIEASGFSDPHIQAEFARRFRDAGVKGARLDLLPRDSARQYLIYNEMDICLDPFPYCGGTSSLDLLWMGVPMVTKRGIAGMSTTGETLLSHLDRREWVAIDEADYIEKALALSQSVNELNMIRMAQRPRMQGSFLMNGPAFGRGFSDAFEKMRAEHSL